MLSRACLQEFSDCGNASSHRWDELAWPVVGVQFTITAAAFVSSSGRSIFGDAQFRRHIAPLAVGVRVDITLQSGVERLDGTQHGRQRVGEPGQVPVRDLCLLSESIAAPMRVGRVGRPIRIEVVDPAVRAVVDGESQDRHVVGIHDSVHEAHAHPMRAHDGSACAYLSEPFGAYRFGQCLTCMAAMRGKQLREIAPNGEVDELRQQK